MQLYRTRRAAVQALVSFKIPAKPTPYQRSKVKRYHDYLFGSTHEIGITQGVRARVVKRDPAALKKLQDELGQGALPGIKYAFPLSFLDPVSGAVEPVAVKSRKNKPDVVTVGNVAHISMKFDKIALARNPNAEISRVMVALKGLLPPHVEAYGFQVNNGGWLYGSQRREAGTLETIKNLMHKYRSNGPVASRDRWRDWRHWLDGLTMQYADNQRTLHAVLTSRNEAAKIRKKIRQINLTWTNLLDVMRSTRAANTEAIAQAYAGSSSDALVPAILREMRERRLVTGDDNRWTITATGRAYFANAKDLLAIADNL